MTTILTVLGARPQFVKAAVVSMALRRQGIGESIVHTGQHFDTNMSKVFFDELEVPVPDFHLGIGGGTHGQNTGRMIERIEEVAIHRRPDLLMVYGDTDSTLAGALAAAKLHIPVAHVEAGLRSFNRRMPEEINRVVADHVSALLFAPTALAVSNLRGEGIERNVHLVGDVMLDAAMHFGRRAEQESAILERIGIASKSYALATVHRAENVDDPRQLKEIFAGLARLDLEILLPLHPRTRQRIESFGIVKPVNVRMIDPVGYLDMVMLEKAAKLILTDSGGVQKEAFFHSVPCVTLRRETEWVELVEAGWNRLATTAAEIAVAATEALKTSPSPTSLYGDGTASDRIAAVLAATGLS